MFKNAGAWILNQIDLLFRRNIVAAAEMNVGDIIVGVVTTIAGYEPRVSYTDIGQCVGLVRQAYATAGICLDQWSGCGSNLVSAYGISGSNGVSYLYNLAEALDIPEDLGGSVRREQPLAGDMVFFDNTYDANGDCNMSNDGQLHVGIVTKVNTDGNGTNQFVHASSKGVISANMNVSSAYLNNTTSVYNSPLRRGAKPVCWTCPYNADCSGSGGCTGNSIPYDWCTEEQWDSRYGPANYSGQLFGGYGTVRNVILQTIP